MHHFSVGPLGGRRRTIIPLTTLFALAALALAFAFGSIRHATARQSGPHPTGTHQPIAQTGGLLPFNVTGLPAGTAMGVPIHTTFPAGTTLKHTHGGPTFVYVISGSLDIIDSDGTTMTYGAGSFFAEGPGHIHTLQVKQAVEVFVLQFLPPGAESTIPVQ